MTTKYHRRCVVWAHLAGLALLLGTCVVPKAAAKTFVIPHVLEKSGTISDTRYTFDTTLYLTYNRSLSGKDGGSAAVELYLYDNTGQLMKNNGADVCGPCGFQLDAQNRKQEVRIDDLITRGGSTFDQATKVGFAVIVVSGDEDAVNVHAETVNSHTNAADLAVFGFEPQPIAAAAQRAFVLPHVLETSGKTSSSQYSFDTVLFATYVDGLPGTPPGSSAELQLYLYDDATGAPMTGDLGTTVCNPCLFNLGNDQGTIIRKRSIILDDLITAASGFNTQKVRTGFAVIVVGGEDPGGVSLESFVVNSHTSAFDLSVFSSEPQPVSPRSTPSQKKTFVLPHILEKSGLTTEPYTFDTTLFATYTPGLAGLPDGTGSVLELYLYANTGEPLRGLNGSDVCAPCLFNLGTEAAGTAAPRKQTIRIDDLIMNQGGGFDVATKTGFAVMVVGGDDPDGVNLEAFVVNSHTGPFDLSVFGFEPTQVGAAARSAGTDPSGAGASAKAFVLPHVLEKSGSISQPFSVDNTLFAVYAGGRPGTVQSNGASMKLYLYDSTTGQPLMGAVGPVCNPCLFDLTFSQPKQSIRIEDLIMTNGGGFGNSEQRDAFGIAVLDGELENVSMETFVVNSHTSAFDLSVFGFEPQPIAAARVRPMPVQINVSALGMELSVPTVIGGKYTVETQSTLGAQPWLPVNAFDGDGTVKTIPIPPSGQDQQFLRVSAH